MPGRIYNLLYDLAEDQHGLFATHQARSLGVRTASIVMMERRGMLDRIAHGVYGLVHFPSTPLAACMEAVLWPQGRTGVLWGKSALELYASGMVGTPIEIALPAGYRTRRPVPRRLTTVRAALGPEDIIRWHGIPTLAPERLLKECLPDGRSTGRLAAALDRWVEAGLLYPERANAVRITLEARNASSPSA